VDERIDRETIVECTEGVVGSNSDYGSEENDEYKDERKGRQGQVCLSKSDEPEVGLTRIK
jgi:hypothetical protein